MNWHESGEQKVVGTSIEIDKVRGALAELLED
jgi:hypothetical protein